MSTSYGKKRFGLFENGDFSKMSNENFNFGGFSSSGQYNGVGCLMTTGGGGSSFQSPTFIKVDRSKIYQMAARVKTFQRGSAENTLAGGHIGVACYDKDFNFINIYSCGDSGNTTLSRDLNAGDSSVYINSSAGWSQSATSTYRHVLIYPSGHPDYSTPWEYTRIGYGDYTIQYDTPIVAMAEGDYRLDLQSTFPDIGYATPSGTPVSNGQAGGTYTYLLGNENYDEEWGLVSTQPFSGSTRSSDNFRHGTEYVKFLILKNYNRRTESPQDHVWGIDNIFLAEVGNKDYRGLL